MNDIPSTVSTVKRGMNPWLLVMLAVGCCLTLVTGGLLFLVWVTPATLTAPANEVELKDGTILRIEAMTTGTSHRYSWDWSPSSFFWDRRIYPIHHATSGDNLVVWMSRRDKTGRPLDFEWWLRSVVVDANGDEIGDSNPRQFEAGRSSMGSHGGTRPMRADRATHSTWLVCSAFPKFRTNDGRFTLRVMNVMDEVVGSIDLTHPSPPTVPEWTAETLPTRKTNGELEVTFQGLTARHHQWQREGRPFNSWTLAPELSVTWKGETTSEWQSISQEVTDSMGNVWNGWESFLSSREPAWKVKLGLFKTPQSKFDDAEKQELARVELPAEKSHRTLADLVSINGATVGLLALAGHGQTDYHLAASSSRGTGTSSHSSYAFGQSCQIETKTVGSHIQVKVNAPFPHLVVQANALSPIQRLYVLARDDQDREVPTQEAWLDSRLRVIFFKPEADSREIRLTAIVHTGREFEFFVKPPELKVPEPNPDSASSK